MLYVSVCMWVCAHECRAFRDQKEATESQILSYDSYEPPGFSAGISLQC